MTSELDVDRILEDWLAQGPSRMLAASANGAVDEASSAGAIIPITATVPST